MIRARDEDGTLRSWPLYVLAAPATVAVWSGWVGLGGMTGFGKVHPLPGIWDSATINTAITLPIGVEAYAAYALGAWLTRKKLSKGTRDFARLSAIGALILGALGQIAYHLLEVGHKPGTAISAPAWITTLVACFPVLVLGMGATLAHLIHRDGDTEADEPNDIPVAELATDVAPEDRQLGDNSAALPVANTAPEATANERQDEPPTGDNEDAAPGDSSTPATAPEPRQQKPRTVAKKTANNRRSMDEWVEVAGPIYHAEFNRLKRQPTGYEFAAAIKKAKLGNPSASTAKNIRAEILDREPLPSLDDETTAEEATG